MDLVKAPIPQLVRRIAVPASGGFFFNTMFNVVDSLVAGLDSTDALAALAASFPIQWRQREEAAIAVADSAAFEAIAT